MPMSLRFAFFAVLVAASFLVPAQGRAAEKLTVLLDWFVNPDHAPLIIAKERGLFAAAGLDVEFVPPADPSAPPRLVAAGQADIAISYQPNLTMQIAEGLPLTRIGTLVETPLNTLVALKDSDIGAIGDLKGKTIGYSVGGFEDALLKAMLAEAHLTLDDVKLVNVNFALSPSLISGQVDAVIGAFRNFELTQLRLEGREGIAFFPEEHGVPAYDELVFLAANKTLADPRLATFVAVVEEATIWMTNHPDDGWTEFTTAHPELDDTLNRQAYQDTLPRFAKRPAALDKARYARFSSFMKDMGLIDTIAPVDSFAVELPTQ